MVAHEAREIVYADRDGRPLRLDLYLPAGAEYPVPIIAHFHGGGWVSGERGIFPPNEDLVRAGFAIADIEYRLTGEAIWPAQEQDASDAIQWLRRNGRDHGLDPARMGAWGLSAGGHLTAMMAVQRSVAAVVLLAAPLDLRDSADWPEASHEYLADLFGERGVTSRPRDPFASPITHDLRGAPPTLMIHGDLDELVPIDAALRYYDLLRASGVVSAFVRLSHTGHDPGASFLGWDGIADLAIRHFRTHLR